MLTLNSNNKYCDCHSLTHFLYLSISLSSPFLNSAIFLLVYFLKIFNVQCLRCQRNPIKIEITLSFRSKHFNTTIEMLLSFYQIHLYSGEQTKYFPAIRFVFFSYKIKIDGICLFIYIFIFFAFAFAKLIQCHLDKCVRFEI